MSLSRRWAAWVVKHNKLVIVLWVLALLVSAPLAAQLERYLSYTEKQWLPSNAESLRLSSMLPNYTERIVFVAHLESPARNLARVSNETASLILEAMRGVVSAANATGPGNLTAIAASSTRGVLSGLAVGAAALTHGVEAALNATLRAVNGSRAAAKAAWMLVNSSKRLLEEAPRVYSGAARGAEELIKAYKLLNETVWRVWWGYLKAKAGLVELRRAYWGLLNATLRTATSISSLGAAVRAAANLAGNVTAALLNRSATVPPVLVEEARALVAEGVPPQKAAVIVSLGYVMTRSRGLAKLLLYCAEGRLLNASLPAEPSAVRSAVLAAACSCAPAPAAYLAKRGLPMPLAIDAVKLAVGCINESVVEVDVAKLLAAKSHLPVSVIIEAARASPEQLSRLAEELVASRLEEAHIPFNATRLVSLVVEYARRLELPKLVDKLFLERAASRSPLPPKLLLRLVKDAVESNSTSRLVAYLIRYGVAEKLREHGAPPKLVNLTLSGGNPVVEAIIKWRGRVPSEAAARAIEELLLRLGFPEWMARMALEARSLAELVANATRRVVSEVLAKLAERLHGEAYEEVSALVNWTAEHLKLPPPSRIVGAVVRALEAAAEDASGVVYALTGLRVNTTLLVEAAARAALHLADWRGVNATVAKWAAEAAESEWRSLLGYMASRDNTTFIVIASTAGASDRQLYEAALRASKLAAEHGISLYFAGGPATSIEIRASMQEDISRIDKLSMAMVLIVLLAVMESLVASVIPFIAIGSSVVAGTALVTLIASHGYTVSTWARGMMVSTAMGLGIDYTAYLVARLREVAAEVSDPRRAVEEALALSLPGIVGSAVTDFLGFASFLLAWDVPFMRSLGIAIPPVVFAVALASVTLVPAILVYFADKRWFWWPRGPRRLGEEAKPWLPARLAAKHPWAAIALLVILAVPASYMLITFHGGYDVKLFLPPGTHVYEAVTLAEEKLKPGALYPVLIAVKFNPATPWRTVESFLGNLTANITRMFGARVYGPLSPAGRLLPPSIAGNETLVSKLASRYIIAPHTYLLRVELPVNPLSSRGIEEVAKLRSYVHRVARSKPYVEEVLVGGQAAMMVELRDYVNSVFKGRVIPFAAAAMALSMFATFRCWSAAVLPLISVWLGVSYAIAATDVIFAVLLGVGLLWFLPTMLLVATLGVGMDYNSFYINRARQEAEQYDTRTAALRASAAVAKLVMGLALIVSSSYAAMVLARSMGFKEMGASMALSILFTAAIAVLLLWPAALAILGDLAWEPNPPKRTRKQ